MDITTVANGTTAATSSGSADSMGKNDFLKLFIAQLQNQNPLNPIDSTGFTSQLAQFSSLEQLTNINTALSNLTSNQNYSQNALAAGLIGKTVVASGNQTTLNGTASINCSLAEDAADVTVTITDASGKKVREVSLGQQKAGSVSYRWDGTDAQGIAQPNGSYTFTVKAVDATGKSVDVTTLMEGAVLGVTFQNNVTYLVLNNGCMVSLSDIKAITN
ncbi:MAG: flagellar hook capping FlgD N-terminal domain-containing protein [Nitrospirota bacterium]